MNPGDRLVTMPEGLPKLTLGWEAVRWASKYLRQPNGERAGQRWEFVDSQIRFLLWWYAVDENGEWLYRHGVRRLAKGAGKSPMAAVISLAEFTAPLRLKDFDSSALGGCVGKPVQLPWVQIAATSEAQTKNTMRMVRALCPKKSRLAADFEIDVGKTQFFRPPEGTLEQITSSATTAEGGEASSIIADETEHWTGSNGGQELGSTLQDNLSKSGSRMLETCNSWVPGIGSVAEDTWSAWLDQEAGRTRGNTKILYDARVAPPDTDMSDRDSLESALRFVYDDCYWVRIHPITERIWDPRSKPSDVRRKYLNQPTAHEDSWMSPQEWASIAAPETLVGPNEPIVMFFDGSKSRDASALVGCTMDTGHVFLIDSWEPKDGETVPTHAVDAAVARAKERYEVVGFFSDVREWESFAKVSWPELFGDSLLVSAVPGGREPHVIAWDMRSRTSEFTKACELFLAEVQDASFTHDGSEVLSRHILNARLAPNRYGDSIRKESKDSPRKIDAGVCAIGARMVRRLVLSSPGWEERSSAKTRKVLVW